MRICIITNGYPLTPTDFPGIFNYHFACELRLQGHDVYVFTPDRHGQKEISLDVPVHWFRWLGGRKPLTQLNPLKPLDFLRLVSLFWAGSSGIVRLSMTHSFDTYLAMWTIPSGLFAYMAKKRFGTPYSVWALGADIWTLGRNPITRPLVCKVLSNADLVFADGLGLAREVEMLSGRKCEFLSTTRKLPPQQAVDLVADKARTRFIFIGRLEKVKGIDVLLEAARLLLKEDGEIALYIWGVGSLQSSLLHKIKEYQLGTHIFLKGYATPVLAASHLGACDCLVIPSRMESIPVVFSDAMQVGTPVIVSNVGDMGSLVKEYGVGKVVEPGDPIALKEAMKAFALERDHDYRDSIRSLASKFDLTRNAEEYICLTQVVLDSKAAGINPNTV